VLEVEVCAFGTIFASFLLICVYEQDLEATLRGAAGFGSTGV
jgi:dUTPase